MEHKVRLFLISRVTLFSLLLGVFLASGIRVWTVEHMDDCARYLAGDKTLPPTQRVEVGTRTIQVPCSNWIMRQPTRMQGICLIDLVLLVTFVLNAMLDMQRWLQMRRRMRAAG